jgi:thiol-disulfide isomerase/thioredoxin
MVKEHQKAPEFPARMEWLNTTRPLILKELRGKVVLLDFWTYCCINCMHTIPDLKKLETKHKDELVVIGVHSAKFLAERQTDNIRQAILRYDIEHPVVNDKDMAIWDLYGVRAWPTLYLIDPEGKIVGYHSGEGIYEPFDQAIAELINEFDKKGLINRKPLHLTPEQELVPESMLSFPGKVLANEASNRLFIADSGHNRIIVTSLDGIIQDVVGSGAHGFDDGQFSSATFNHPQGMAFLDNILYVADTENHTIRQLDLDKRIVTTIAGTGRQGGIASGGIGTEVSLSSPWDLAAVGKQLFIAMAGIHQIWKMDLETHRIGPYAGSGAEGRVDGPLTAAALAQPSGITTDGTKLYFVDSETSSIRMAGADGRGNVETIVGVDLFVFGDKDGVGNEVRLQHPLGIAYGNSSLYAADTYNSKIKKVEPKTRKVTSLFGTGQEGHRDGKPAMFNEPGGLSIAAGRLFIADTDNHLIRVADLSSGIATTLELKKLEKLASGMRKREFAGDKIVLKSQKAATGVEEVIVSLELPSGYKLNKDAPSAMLLAISHDAAARFEGSKKEITFENPQFPLTVPIKLLGGAVTINAQFVLYYCHSEKESLCYFKHVQLEAPIETAAKGASQIRIHYTLPMA